MIRETIHNLISQNLRYDLHIHTCLSPCAENDMTPGNIIEMAYICDLHTIAITDHNSCKNCATAMHFGEQFGINVIPGMEISTVEDIHVVCLFETIEDAMRFDEFVYSKLPDFTNILDVYGTQELINTKDEVCGFVEKLLIGNTKISWFDLPGLMEEYNGYFYPAHIDKKVSSILSYFKRIPEYNDFDIIEIKFAEHLPEIEDKHPLTKNFTKIFNSDAHYLWEIGSNMPLEAIAE